MVPVQRVLWRGALEQIRRIGQASTDTNTKTNKNTNNYANKNTKTVTGPLGQMRRIGQASRGMMAASIPGTVMVRAKGALMAISLVTTIMLCS